MYTPGLTSTPAGEDWMLTLVIAMMSTGGLIPCLSMRSYTPSRAVKMGPVRYTMSPYLELDYVLVGKGDIEVPFPELGLVLGRFCHFGQLLPKVAD